MRTLLLALFASFGVTAGVGWALLTVAPDLGFTPYLVYVMLISSLIEAGMVLAWHRLKRMP